MSAVIVKLTEAQLNRLYALAHAVAMGGDGDRVLAGALEALAQPIRPFTEAEWDGLIGAAADAESLNDDDVLPGDIGYAAWRRRRAATDRALQKVRSLR